MAGPFPQAGNSSPFLLTYADLITRATRFIKRRGVVIQNGAEDHAEVRSCIQAAIREVCGRRSWRCLIKPGRIQLNASYDTGTITYDHTGGTYEREVTLATGTWPTWAKYGTLRANSVNCKVERRVSGSVITLDPTVNFGADVAAGTTYTLYQSIYSLPNDFIAIQTPLPGDDWYGAEWVNPDEWHALERWNQSGGTPQFYTIAKDVNVHGHMAVYLYPYPSEVATWDFMYQSRPRAMVFGGFDDGDCKGTVATSTASTTVTGTDTAFASDMVGAIIRFSVDGITLPTGLDGHNPRVDERTIVSVESATSLTLDQAPSSTLTASKYMISDPVDLEQGLLVCLQRCVEKHLSIVYGFENREGKDVTAIYERHYENAYVLACEQDSRLLAQRSPYPRLMDDSYTVDTDV